MLFFIVVLLFKSFVFASPFPPRCDCRHGEELYEDTSYIHTGDAIEMHEIPSDLRTSRLFLVLVGQRNVQMPCGHNKHHQVYSPVYQTFDSYPAYPGPQLNDDKSYGPLVNTLLTVPPIDVRARYGETTEEVESTPYTDYSDYTTTTGVPWRHIYPWNQISRKYPSYYTTSTPMQTSRIESTTLEVSPTTFTSTTSAPMPTTTTTEAVTVTTTTPGPIYRYDNYDYDDYSA